MAESERSTSKEARWREVLARQAASGLSVRAFCRQESIREPSFYFWRRTLREREAKQPPAAAFVPAVVRELPVGEEAIVIKLAAGAVLQLPVTMSPTWVAQFVQALEAGSAS